MITGMNDVIYSIQRPSRLKVMVVHLNILALYLGLEGISSFSREHIRAPLFLDTSGLHYSPPPRPSVSRFFLNRLVGQYFPE